MQDVQNYDVIVLGAGMAGASIAAELAGSARVLLVEMEDQPGRHTTGRSAAMFFESYGNPVVRALTRASREFLLQPPPDIAGAALMHRRDAFIVADAESLSALDALEAGAVGEACLHRVTPAEVLTRCPILRAERVAAALRDSSGHDIDVAGLHRRAVAVGAAGTSCWTPALRGCSSTAAAGRCRRGRVAGMRRRW